MNYLFLFQASSGAGAAPGGKHSADNGQYPEEAITNLMGTGGFSREQVIGALQAANGNPEVAAGFLLGS